ncbi:MAG: hypothetical protein QM497_00815 [Sulfurimonas sp.]
MNVYIKLFTLSLLLVSLINAQEVTQKRDRINSVRKVVDSVGKIEKKDISMVDSFKHMFTDGKVSGQVRTIYAAYNQKEAGAQDTYATAIGGILKYELAEFKGFNAGVAVYTSHDIAFATGSGVKQNSEISSTSGDYTEMAEAYINYEYEDLSLRVGRQVLDTPLADSDDIRMIQNSFNAYVLSYNYAEVEFMAGNIQSWQGTDAGLDDAWQDIGSNGANFAGLAYNDGLEFGVWYYNITSKLNAVYFEFGGSYELNKDMQIYAMTQYLNEKELNSSGFAANIYGAMFEFVAYDIGFNVAYNKADKKTGLASFSGTGGGSLFTSMDTMIIDNIAIDREADAFVAGLSYTYDDFNFLYAFGDFNGDADSSNVKAHIVEQDIGFEYNVNDEFLIAALYVLSEDKESSAKTADDWERVQVIVNYNF